MIKFKRQDGGASSSSPASPPSSLAYGEPAISSDGTLYVGSGAGSVVSKVKNADSATNASHATSADNATNATNATNASNAAKADDAMNGLWEFFATYTMDGWSGSNGNWTQTKTITAKYGNATITAASRLGAPQTEQTSNFTTNETKLEALALINAGECTPGAGTVTIRCNEKPTCDIDVHWYVKIL